MLAQKGFKNTVTNVLMPRKVLLIQCRPKYGTWVADGTVHIGPPGCLECRLTICRIMVRNFYNGIAARSKAWDYGRSIAGIVGSNPAVGTNICLL